MTNGCTNTININIKGFYSSSKYTTTSTLFIKKKKLKKLTQHVTCITNNFLPCIPNNY